MEHLTAIIGHLAWPATAILLGLICVRELKSGLLTKVMPNGGLIEGAGFKVQTYAAKQSTQNANVEVTDAIEVAPGRGLTPYDQVIAGLGWVPVDPRAVNRTDFGRDRVRTDCDRCVFAKGLESGMSIPTSRA